MTIEDATLDDPTLDDVPSTEPLVLRMIREPEPWVQMAGMMQLPLEMSAYLASVPVLSTLPRGDGHPVLVMPGFMGGDMSTLPLRYHLYLWGYDVRGFGEAPNPGPTRSVLDRMSHRLESIHERTGRTVSLVGWSAGALYARHLARHHPKRVRQVITLAGGLQHRIRTDRSSISFITRFIQRTFDPDFGVQPDFVEGSLPVPSTSIYSRTGRRGALGVLPRRGRRQPREHRGLRQPRRHRRQPLGALRRRRPPRPARGGLAAVLPAALDAVALPDRTELGHGAPHRQRPPPGGHGSGRRSTPTGGTGRARTGRFPPVRLTRRLRRRARAPLRLGWSGGPAHRQALDRVEEVVAGHLRRAGQAEARGAVRRAGAA